MTTQDEIVASPHRLDRAVTDLLTGPWPGAKEGKRLLREASRHFLSAQITQIIEQHFARSNGCQHRNSYEIPQCPAIACMDCLCVVEKKPT